MPLVSIVVPVYNEIGRLAGAVRQINAVNLPAARREVVVVDDGSTDGSRDVIADLERRGEILARAHLRNLGKGAALRTGFAAAGGEYLIVQDADGEYDPAEYGKLLEPLMSGRADVVYGNRMHRGNPVGYRRYWLGNYVISLWCSVLFGRRVHDVETGFKAFRRDALARLPLRADRFDFEVECTVRALQAHLRLVEVPISYHPRKFTQGKKITWRDGVQALWLLLKFRFAKGETST
ncbi:MAG: glycosyltransferase family 2 protein [Patescibacteria group bacterium]|nr:glycosyltransferase family 2 protein [Patescibacteria group bacterium]